MRCTRLWLIGLLGVLVGVAMYDAGLFNLRDGLNGATLGALRVNSVRLKPAPGLAGVPYSTLNFELLNEGNDDISHIVVEIMLMTASVPGRSRVLAGPYTIHQKPVLHAGHRLNLELVLRNLSADCACVPKVKVLSARHEKRERGREADGPALNPSEAVNLRYLA